MRGERRQEWFIMHRRTGTRMKGWGGIVGMCAKGNKNLKTD